MPTRAVLCMAFALVRDGIVHLGEDAAEGGRPAARPP